MLDLDPVDLDLAIRVARRARLLGRLCVAIDNAGKLDELPGVAADQLVGARVQAESRGRLALWELDRIAWATRGATEYPLIAMKGCAYILTGSPNAAGRFFADVDLMVPEVNIAELEEYLNERGWKSAELSPYDQNYYRNWTHELPPLMHIGREVEIDLHHNILPRTARLKPDSRKLLKAARPVDGSSYHVLCDEDLVLHAVTHLMQGDDLADKFRDLVDIDDLCRHFARDTPGFWARLLSRASELDLRRPVYYGLRYCVRLLETPVPDDVIDRSKAWAPIAPIRYVMDKCVPAALLPEHPDHRGRGIALARLLLYVRSHWLRMPPWLLAYHLTYKFFVIRFGRRSHSA
jgi:hypothetical protein